MTGKYDYLGIAGEVLEQYESAISESTLPTARLRAAFSAVTAHEQDIEKFFGHVVPEGTRPHSIPSLETLLESGPYKNSLDGNRLTIVFNDGSGLYMIMPRAAFSPRDALVDPFPPSTFKVPHP